MSARATSLGRAGLVALALTSGCLFARYEPGELRARANARKTQVVTVGCLDVAMTPASDPHVPEGHPLVRFAFGNRCEHPVPVDFTAVTVAGVYAEGRVALYAVDPRRELHPATLDAHAEAHEVLEFAPVLTRAHGPASVCVNVSGLAHDDATPERATRCFALPSPATNAPSQGDLT